MAKKFTRTIEDFICGNCGEQVIGNGYTNHCPKCLWSKHVDVNPGDRLALSSCGGLMKPIAGEKASGKMDKMMILHKCVKCGFERRNSLDDKDDFDAFVKISVVLD